MPNEADCPIFVNADMIAAELSPLNQEGVAIKAGRLMLEEIAGHVKRGTSFAFETTLSGRGYVRLIRAWREQGYFVKIFFLALAGPNEAVDRVAERVLQGGHHVADEVVRRRFAAGWNNFHEIYKFEVDAWRWYDNSGDIPILVDEGQNA